MRNCLKERKSDYELDGIFLTFVLILNSFWVIRLKRKISDLELDKEIAEKRIQEIRDHRYIEITLLQNQILSDQKTILELQKVLAKRRPENMEIPEGTIAAVRYAMVHNHPDNGGDSEKFILYKRCYEELTGRK